MNKKYQHIYMIYSLIQLKLFMYEECWARHWNEHYNETFHGHILQILEALYQKYREIFNKIQLPKGWWFYMKFFYSIGWVLPMDYFLIINGAVDLTHWETKPPPFNLKMGMYMEGKLQPVGSSCQIVLIWKLVGGLINLLKIDFLVK